MRAIRSTARVLMLANTVERSMCSRAVNVLDRHQSQEVGVGFVVIEGQLCQLANGGLGRQVLDVEGLLRIAQLGVGALQDGDVQPLLAAEVVVDHALGGAHAIGDLVDAGAGVTAFGELGGGDLEDLGAGALGVALSLGGHSRWQHSSSAG